MSINNLYKDILKKYWGYSDFRGIQSEIIQSIVSGRDTLGLMPTGGGKSITFQVPALAKEGTCIVITPLISLMKDQVENLKRHKISAAAIHSGLNRNEVITILENCIFGTTKLLYIAPERLSSELFLSKLKHINVSFITVDEAHCISQWGYDFRPSYLKIINIRTLLPKIPILALTATATPEVQKDIQEKLGFKEDNIFKMSFERKNLAYILKSVKNKENEILRILHTVKGSSIIYCRNRGETREVAKFLISQGENATWYHAGLDSKIRSQRQTEWQSNKYRIIVATSAFGMGIDKPDVRSVIHYDFPIAPEYYFQEAGRAGRDGKKSFAFLLYNKGNTERSLKIRLNIAFPKKETISSIYEHLAYYGTIGVGSGKGTTIKFSIKDFCNKFGDNPVIVDSALKILTRAGYLDYSQDIDDYSRIRILLKRDELYRITELTTNENKILVELMRTYSGLFIDYHYIDEQYIAKELSIGHHLLYDLLVGMTKKGIISYIPKRNLPIVRYIRDRVDGDKIILSKEVYDNRKAKFKERINTMINYAENAILCRSRMLLNYFGEEITKDCGQCDICISHKKSKHETITKLKHSILLLLSDGRQHNVTELNNIELDDVFLDHSDFKIALDELISEELIYIDGSYCEIAKKK